MLSPFLSEHENHNPFGVKNQSVMEKMRNKTLDLAMNPSFAALLLYVL